MTARTSRRAFRTLLVAGAMTLLMAACEWPMAGHNAARTHSNPLESTVSAANVAQLRERNAYFSGAAAAASTARSSPTVSSGFLYVGADNGFLFAYDVAAVKKCRGIPPNCDYVWFANMPVGTQRSSPTVANGTVYLGAPDGKVYAFDADGETNCSSMPYMPTDCEPLRTYAAAGPVASSPVVLGGVLYVTAGTTGRTLYAFDAAGATGCTGSPASCPPLWTATLGGAASDPTVAAGRVFVGATDGKLYAFDANGATNCSAGPRVCSPLWTASLGGPTTAVQTPSYARGSVYAVSTSGRLAAFDASGAGCTGTPVTCTPRWRSTIGVRTIAPAIAGDVVYSATRDGIEAFDASGVTSCTGTPKVCAPLWTAVANSSDTPAIANGVLYAGEPDGGVHAFDATGTTACSGAQKICQPLWSATAAGAVIASPLIVNGTLFVRAEQQEDDGVFRSRTVAFSLPVPRIWASNEGNGPTVYVQGDRFPASSAGTVTVNNIDQSNSVATVDIVTLADGSFTTSATVPTWRCGDRVDVTTTVGTSQASYRALLDCQI